MITAKRGNFHFLLIAENENHAKLGPYGYAVWKVFNNLAGKRIGCNIVVIRGAVEQHVTDAAPGQISFVAVLA